MRPLKLTLQNFGPYRDQTIDFEEFNDVPVFLISGKTGAGKTTIFDAMCFALFGRSSGGDRQPDQMRSDFAEPTAETVVTFIFEHLGQQYTITRKPKQTLAKKRGTGVHDQEASVELTMFAADGEETTLTKRRDVDAKVTDLLHLNAAQFMQIVLLPQGQFRQFLEADSNDKQKLLANLFGTSLYARWAAKLNEQLKAAQAGVQGKQNEVAALRQLIYWQDNQAPDEDANDQDVLSALTVQNDAMQPEVTKQQQAVTSAQKQLDLLNDQVKSEETLLQYFSERDQALQRQTELVAQQPEMDALQANITDLEWVQTLVSQLDELDRAKATTTEIEQRIQHTQTDHDAAVTTLATAKTAEQALQAQQADEQKRQTEIADLTARRPLFAQVDQLKLVVTKQQQQAKTLQDQAAELNQRRTTAQTQLSQLQATLTELGNVSHQQLTLQEQQHQVDGLAESQLALTQQHEQLVGTQTQETQLQAAVQKAQQQDQDAIATFAKIDHEWTVSQIQRLSAKLAPGEPCPVCGSTEHPAPAVQVATLVSEDEVKQAQATQEQSHEQLTKVTAQLTETTKRVTEQQVRYDETAADWCADVNKLTETPAATLAAAQLAFEKIQNDVQQARQAVSMAVSKQKQTTIAITETTTTIDRLTEQLAAVAEQQHALEVTLATQQAQLTDQLAQLPNGFADLAAVDTQVTVLQEASAQFTTALSQQTKERDQAQQQVTTLQTQLQELASQKTQTTANVTSLTEQLTTVITNHDSEDSLTSVKERRQQLAKLSVWRQSWQVFTTAVAQVKGQLATLTTQIGKQVKPDVQQTIVKRDQQQAQLETLRAASYALSQQLTSNQKLAESISAALVEGRAQREQLAQIAELADTVAGRTKSHLSLERYVLQTYLQQVLTVANSRLSVLTNNRYRFELEASAGSFATDTGLEINVFDDQAGKVRSVHTLSGGESFIAALSLALGLGEVIQNESGAVAIEALFIDEGFGSLDEDALQTAMEALQTIEGQHRMIGIISHVTELQEQIPDQLIVTASADGRSQVGYQHEL
ncbi:AAA family ATPase [Furfurilactobacillus siliginis]|uniref:Nuclease SbcCD subunit C n=1 Tax=Furfurilactobacillus siliginis TaxID=348151 RepID=A0A0R2LGU1_9LACO|nr:SMC family ATPase [Furfurilactobacillus siliginis]KRN97268.1 exonuclease SbcC [Furfurilactobacillus siliginis]GEK29151.1 nuclease SbcCD subunit C [Furfurilactobacillus siliginis]